MAQENIKDVKQLLSNPSLLYAMVKNDSKHGYPIEVDQHGNQGVAIYDPLGRTLRYVNRELRVSATPCGYDVAKNNVSFQETWSLIGAVDDVDNVTETVWSNGGAYVFPTAGMQMEIVSTSDEDSSGEGLNPAGTGVRYIHIHYLDDSWNEQIETIALDGTNVVTTTATNIFRVNKLHTVKSPIGTTKAAVGTIDLRNLANTPIYAQIVVGQNVSIQAVYTVPLGKTAYMASYVVGSGSDGGGSFVKTFISATRDETGWSDGVWYLIKLIPTQDSAVFLDLPIPERFPEKVDIKIDCRADKANSDASISAEFIGWIEDNDHV